jgi:hypothetical protein
LASIVISFTSAARGPWFFWDTDARCPILSDDPVLYETTGRLGGQQVNCEFTVPFDVLSSPSRLQPSHGITYISEDDLDPDSVRDMDRLYLDAVRELTRVVHAVQVCPAGPEQAAELARAIPAMGIIRSKIRRAIPPRPEWSQWRRERYYPRRVFNTITELFLVTPQQYGCRGRAILTRR